MHGLSIFFNEIGYTLRWYNPPYEELPLPACGVRFTDHTHRNMLP